LVAAMPRCDLRVSNESSPEDEWAVKSEEDD
jgi:hypothetical protein